MPRFFIENADSDYIYITGADAHHIARSLRMRPGERLTVCDTRGVDCECEIDSVADEAVGLRVLSRRESNTEPTCSVTLYQGYPKGDKLETVIEKAVELGAARIVPVLTERSIARPDDKSAARKLERWQRRALEAAKQCGRGRIPEVEPLCSFGEMCTRLSAHSLSLFCYELGGRPLRETVKADSRDVAVFIGPEGGISAEEAERLLAAGCVPATLGRRILRTETAPLAALTAIMLLTGNMDN